MLEVRFSTRFGRSSKPSSRCRRCSIGTTSSASTGPNVKKGKNKKDLADQLIADIRNFKQTDNCSRLVMVWCGSTEVYMTEAPVHQSLAAFEKGLECRTTRFRRA